MNNSKVLFITNPKDLNSKIPGGVQLCSQEFLDITQSIFSDVIMYNVNITKIWYYRLKRKIMLDSYDLYDFKRYIKEVIELINDNEIEIVFINKTELIKVAEILKRKKPNLKIVLLSHGNETGDYLHELTHPQINHNSLKLFFKKIRLGLNLFTESYLRHRYVDLVCAMSVEEESIEKWLGAKNVYFLPRVIKPNPVNWNPEIGKIGFVGTLNHTPNYIALKEICEKMSFNSNLKLVIVGSGESEGNTLAKNYSFVKYLGKLNDDSLLAEVSTWMYFINPIFWYSKGASMKLAQAINWQIPIISTVAGARGYNFKSPILNLTPNKVEDFVKEIDRLYLNLSEAGKQHQNLQNHLDYSFSKEEISKILRKKIEGL